MKKYALLALLVVIFGFYGFAKLEVVKTTTLTLKHFEKKSSDFMNGDFISNPLPITPSPENTVCNTNAYTFSYDFSTGFTDSGLDGGCDGTNTGLDIFFSWTATSDALIWNDGAGNPGIIIRDASSGNEITCIDTFASVDYILSGWTIGQDLIIQVYDFGTSMVNPLSFCLSEYTLPIAPDCVINPSPNNNDTNVTAGIVTLNWSNSSSGASITSYDVYSGVLSNYSDQTLRGNTTVTTFDLTNIGFNETVYWRVVPKNGPSENTTCSYWDFTTIGPPIGALCSNPLVINSLPFNDNNSTNGYGDDYSNSPGNTNCGTTDNYLDGDDVVYAYTATSDTQISINLNPAAPFSGLFVYTSCNDIGVNCIAGIANPNSDAREIDLLVSIGITYYIVISTFPQPQTTTYTLDISEDSCINPTVTYSIVDDCINNEFSVVADVIDMGSASTIDITDNQGSAPQSVNSIGMVTFGPYQSGLSVNVNAINGDDSSCFSNSETLLYNCVPSNDNCNTAEIVISSILGQEVWVTGTTISNTASGIIATCGSNGSGRDTWFAVTVPADLIAGEDYIIATQPDPSGTSPLTDTVLSIYSDCSGTEIACDDDLGIGNFSQVTLTEGIDVSPGQVLYLRVNEYGAANSKILGPQDGTFQISAAAAASSLSTETFNLNTLFSYYPNPVYNSFTIKSKLKISNITIFNVIGQEVYKDSPHTLMSIINMSNLQSGVYFVNVTINNISKIIKVIKD
ncbi:T9SS type A sorting domain-containing protein [Olleya sp. YS]|uniref:T9SS type A sorting domain-containing protein n=1 Tax=Olleya sp. YS TaxID=3028318 RepID=UPI00243462A6|nr:T9SS type A sorting domain-containing protein [Olleya sp. YS]WGD34791.1 T9SS type A sorting domain-containing protein [Olleya sp. YS]